jgi:hypothetical protein
MQWWRYVRLVWESSGEERSWWCSWLQDGRNETQSAKEKEIDEESKWKKILWAKGSHCLANMTWTSSKRQANKQNAVQSRVYDGVKYLGREGKTFSHQTGQSYLQDFPFVRQNKLNTPLDDALTSQPLFLSEMPTSDASADNNIL